MDSSLADFFSSSVPLSNWLELPEVPLADEFLACEPPRLPLSDCEARPQLRHQYFETQYRLYRYEATEMLRRAINTIRRAASHFQAAPADEDGTNMLENVNVYSDVRVTGFTFATDGVGQRLVIPTAPVRDIDEEDDSDDVELFCPGALVVLSSDRFNTICYVAVVKDNDGLRENPPSIDIRWSTQDYTVTDPSLSFVLLEPTGAYFESLRHTMVGLQEMCSTTGLLSPYLFGAGPHSIPTAQYLTKDTPVNPKAAKSLDKSQRDAFTQAVTQEISIIQGPPGTGKTFTSNVILQSLVETQRQYCESGLGPNSRQRTPIIVAAQTNHALDQLLQKYMDAPGSRKVVRLGGRSINEKVAACALSKLMRANIPGFRPQAVGRLYSVIDKTTHAFREAYVPSDNVMNAKELWDNGLLSPDQYYSITNDDWESNEQGGEGDLMNWLGTTPDQASWNKEIKLQPRHRLPRAVFVPLPEVSQVGSTADRGVAPYLLANTRNLYDIRPEDRQAVYQYLKERLHNLKHPNVEDLITTYDEACISIRNAKVTNQISCIQAGIQAGDGVDVIGCTATGLLKHRQLLRGLRPQILLVEEAAEIREADTIAGLLPSIEHLILIGDHQQLQPHVSMVELSRDPYRANVSMFERLIKLGIGHKTLLQQRRMIPCLREVVQLFYPSLVDHTPTVSKLPLKVPGVHKPLWWFQHDWPEEPGLNNSVQNVTEAQMIVLFVQYLVQHQRIAPERITMLTYYRGQVDQLHRELANNKRLATCEAEWSVRTVDGFQGEENDIILLSLVRGPNGRAGFLTQENRAIVGLSRARLGMFIFGHKDVLLKGPRRETWAKVARQMKGCQGRALPLCPDPETNEVMRVNHPDKLKELLRKKKKQRKSSSDSEQGYESAEPKITSKPASSENQVPESNGESDGSISDQPKRKLGSWNANLPVSALPKKGDSAEILASEMELVSFDDSSVIFNSPPQKLSWNATPLQPKQPVKVAVAVEELLIQFSDDEASEGTDGEDVASKYNTHAGMMGAAWQLQQAGQDSLL